MDKRYDIAIIGSGIAGMSAALNAKIRKKGGTDKGFNLFLNFSPIKCKKVLPCIAAGGALS